MNTAFLLTGSNMGDRKKNLESAKTLIQQQCGAIVNSSSLYETAAWGKTDQPNFFNQALQVETKLSAEQLMKHILKIEEFMGRRRNEKYGPRSIDIDILLFNQERHDQAFLKIPHPELQNRRFALMPLSEIAAHVLHPVLRQTVSQLLKDSHDKLYVKKI
ncbi:MAG: 2-amino-4-hydroxy-6-hydroxymethyldihydropteridine diphosphokinase [Bacteroidetes bacterium]|nr:MAG: 2-amino-4-hydroxy-6-hydroxymethyldihydropteridine diphosphokinase [Bacteroidota bacterium]